MDENGILDRVQASDLLLLELTSTLRARGLLTREDVAGLLLRAEYTAEAMDTLDEQGFTTTSDHVRASTAFWTKRFGLDGALYDLREQRHDWLIAGGNDPSPLDPVRIAQMPRDV